MAEKKSHVWLWVALIIAVAIIIGAIILSFGGNNKNSNIPLIQSSSNVNVEVLKMDPEIDAVVSFTYNCDWVAGGSTIKCDGTESNTGQDIVIDASNGPVMAVEDSNGCSLNCDDRENLGKLQPGQKVDYTLSCTLPKKQDVTVVLGPAGGIIVTKC